jgi:hypothetical protein
MLSGSQWRWDGGRGRISARYAVCHPGSHDSRHSIGQLSPPAYSPRRRCPTRRALPLRYAIPIPRLSFRPTPTHVLAVSPRPVLRCRVGALSRRCSLYCAALLFPLRWSECQPSPPSSTAAGGVAHLHTIVLPPPSVVANLAGDVPLDRPNNRPECNPNRHLNA